MYLSQARVLRFTKKLVATAEIRVGAKDFNSQRIDPLRAKRASKVSFFHTATCKGTALEIVQSTDSPSAA